MEWRGGVSDPEPSEAVPRPPPLLVCHRVLHCPPVVLWILCSGHIYKFINVDIVSMYICHPGRVERMAVMVVAQFKTIICTRAWI